MSTFEYKGHTVTLSGESFAGAAGEWRYMVRTPQGDNVYSRHGEKFATDEAAAAAARQWIDELAADD